MKKNRLVISGASKGIGLAIAKRFDEAGYSIINLSRSHCEIEAAQQINADFTQPGWVDAARPRLTDLLANSGRVCLVHNSALQVPGTISDIDGESLRTSLEVNIIAPAMLNQLVLDHMPRGSSILYLGSTLSWRATRGMAAYVASKHALAGLMRSTAQDLAGMGIHTACICPGFTNTEMLGRYGGEMLSHLASLMTQNRLIEPREIANTVFHASESPCLNGSMIHADLGFIEP